MKRCQKGPQKAPKPSKGGSLSIGRIGRECTFLGVVSSRPYVKIGSFYVWSKSPKRGVYTKTRFFRVFDVFWRFFHFFHKFNNYFVLKFIIYLDRELLENKVPSMNKYLFIRLRVKDLRPILTDFVVFWRFLGPPQKPPKSEKGVKISSCLHRPKTAFLRNTDETRVFRRFLEKGRFLTFFDLFWTFWSELEVLNKYGKFHY